MADAQAGLNEDIERVLAAARDSLSDEMVSRLSGTVADAIDLVDRVNRTGLAAAIPALAAMVNNGDLDRLAKLARVYGAAEDALTEDTVARLAETLAESLSLLDRLNRGGAARLVTVLARLESSGALQRIADTMSRMLHKLETIERVVHAFEEARAETDQGPRSSGGMGGLWTLMRDPQTQDALRFMVNVGKKLHG
jgi:uncharacterized protein YjgD (DUF1641 family)